MDKSYALQEVLSFLDKSEVLQLQLLNKRCYKVFVPALIKPLPTKFNFVAVVIKEEQPDSHGAYLNVRVNLNGTVGDLKRQISKRDPFFNGKQLIIAEDAPDDNVLLKDTGI